MAPTRDAEFETKAPQYPAMVPADILGLSCRFPESSSASQFWENLVLQRDMVTSDDRRWPVGLHGTPPRSGKVLDFEKFDAPFFAVHGKQAQKMDPQMRKLLEVSWEAWVDSGVDVHQLRGSDRVGVYVGCGGSEVHAAWLSDVPKITGYEQTGCTLSMFANRLSWWFDFQGPSKAIDTACSSSALALHDAVADLTAGRCDYAMVGGASSVLRPATSVAFGKLHMLSPDGTCKSFDAGANGYTRADGIAILILKRSDVERVPRWAAKQPYAQILNIGTNNDGHTKEGITFPSAQAQGSLARQVCRGAGIEPSQVCFVEAHGTGTVAGDGQELGAIDDWYGSGAAGRTAESPLLIGSVKSNMGHCECASGLAGVVKLCLSFENGMLPGNLHYHEPNPNCASLKEDILKVVDKSTPWQGGVAALSSFGFGGSNVHMLLAGKPRQRSRIDISASSPSLAIESPRAAAQRETADHDVIPLAARTAEGMAELVKAIQAIPGGPANVVQPLRRLAKGLAGDLSKFSFRGTLAGGEVRSSQAPSAAPQVWFVFSGNGSQWSQMGQSLLQGNPTFRASLEASAAVLAPLGLDLLAEYASESGWKDPTMAAVGLVSIQIALVDVLQEDYGIVPAGMLGHSAGEIGCAYASGCLTREQTLLVAYNRGRLPVAHGVSSGLMAATGLTAAEAIARVEGSKVVLACDNSPASTTLSGPAGDLRALLEPLKADGVFVREVDTLGIAFHSPALEPLLPELQQELEKAIPEPKPRPATWISTSFPTNTQDPVAHLCSAEYQVHSFRNRVLFTEAAANIPKDAILLEVGPHSILRSPLRQSRPELGYVGLMRKGECGLATLSAAACDLWRKGAAVKWQADKVLSGIKAAEVPRSVLEALTSWDHKVDYPLPKMTGGSGSGAFQKTFELGGEHAFLADHKIGKRILIPATAYLVTAWEALAAQAGKPTTELPVEWSDVKVYQAVQAEADSTVTLAVLLDRSHRFQVLSGTDLIAEGKIKACTTPAPAQKGEEAGLADEPAMVEWPHAPSATVAKEAIYRDFNRTGLQYGPCFQMVQQASVEGSIAILRWDKCWIRFLDGMLQTTILHSTDFQLRIPVGLRYVAILDAATPLPADSEVRVDVDALCGTARSSICMYAGLELSVAPQQPVNSRPVVSRLAWVPYGLRTSQDSARSKYADQLTGLAKTLLLPELNRQAAEGCLPVHLSKVKALLEKAGAEVLSAEAQQDLVSNPGNKLAAYLAETFSKESLTRALEAPEEVLAEHATMLATAFAADPLLSGFGLPELKIMLDTMMENQRSEGFTACEIGAGTGGFTKHVFPELNSTSLTDMMRYTATDAIDVGAELAKAVPSTKLSFQVWDINREAPPAITGQVNVIVASHALHEAVHLPTTLAHIREALLPQGFLLFQELTGPLGAAMWGLAPSAWERQDERTLGPLTDVSHWQHLLQQAGFAEVSVLRCPSGSSAMFLYRKVDASPAPAVLLEGPPLRASDTTMDEWLVGYQAALDKTEPQLTEVEGSEQRPAHVWILGDSATTPGLLGFMRSARKEVKGELLRCVFNADKSTELSPLLQQCQELDLAVNMFKNGRNGSYYAILLEGESMLEGGDPPNGCHMEFASYGNLSSIRWVENAPMHGAAEGALTCKVAFAPLNFRDVMLAYGKLSRDLMAHGKGGDYIGLEFSGIEGQRRVMGVAQQAIATQVATPPHLLWDVPASWSLAEAATVPVAFTTAYYALLIRGRLTKSMSVLIHSGSGAVGLAALQLCLSRGCEVFVTCGSAAKRQFLLETFPGLKEDHIGDSRSTSFEELIMTRTNGRGVHLVLNSLADDKLQASVRCLANRGRLLEIGKYDILKGTPLSMRPLLRNIAYDGIDLDRVFNDPDDITEVQELHKLMQQGIDSGEVQPLPLTVFNRSKAEDAFRYMATGTHIGKCMIQMGADDLEASSLNCIGPKQQNSSAATNTPEGKEILHVAAIAPRPTYTCRSDRSYIVTGGLGGFGLALARWLAQKGARHLVLTSKRGLRTGAQAKVIQQLRGQGVQVEVSTLDVSLPQETEQLVQLAEQHAPVAGIFHLAMVLTDKWIANQTGEGWNAGVTPKAIGAHNLDAASRHLSKLEHFVMFSSIVASAGNEGQTNYGYANSASDRLCEARMAAGLPALSIQWGVIGHVGFVEESMQGKLIGRLSEVSVAQPVDDCLRVLGQMLCGGFGKAAVMGSFWQPSDQLGSNAAGADKDLVTAILDIMGLSADAVSDNDSLAAIGIDSLQLVEVRANIQRALGRPMPLEEIGTLTIGGLRQLAAEAGGGSAAPSAAEPKPTAAALPAGKETPAVPEKASSEPASPAKAAEKTPTPSTPEKVEQVAISQPAQLLAAEDELKKPLTPRSVISVTSWSNSQPPLGSALKPEEELMADAAAAKAAAQEDEAEMRRWVAWRAMSGVGILLIGVMLWSTAVPAFSYAASSAASHSLLAVLPLLPALWLLYGSCICLAAVVAKKLLMPVLHPLRPIQLWSLDFARWWLVHRVIAIANVTFAGHLRGTALLPWFYRALGARIGEGAFIDCLDVMDLDMLEVGKNAAIGEGATITAHTFKDGYLQFSEVVLGDDCQIQPFAIITAGTRLQDKAVVEPLAGKPVAAGKLRNKAAAPSQALNTALSSVIESKEVGETATLSLQVAGLYILGLGLTLAAFVGYAILGHILCFAGMEASLAFQPAAFASAAMVAMTSPIYIAFLPILVTVDTCLGAGALLQGIALLAALPAAIAIFGLTFTCIAWLLKLIAVGHVPAGVHRRHSMYGARFWFAQRLVDVSFRKAGILTIGTWGANAFYRLFGARVSQFATFRFGNCILTPDMLSVGEWAHIGDTANVVTSIALDNLRMLTAPVMIEAQALLGVSSVVLPGTTIGKGSTLGALASPALGATLQPSFVHMGHPALPVMRAAPGSTSGDRPTRRAMRFAAAVFPAIQIATALGATSFAVVPAMALAGAAAGIAAAHTSFAVLLAAGVTVAMAASLALSGQLLKQALVGTLQPQEGIRKYSSHNFRRMLAWVTEVAANDLMGELGRASPWWNDVLRSRGICLGKCVYVDTVWSGDYELMSYGNNAIIDRSATLFAHLGMYRNGELSMVQRPAAIQSGAIVGPRAAILPGYVLKAGKLLSAGELGMPVQL